MKKKEKLILGIILIFFGTAVNLFFTAALDGILSGRVEAMSLMPMLHCIKGLFHEQRQFLLFLSFEGFLLLCTVLFFVQNSRSYQSSLYQITEDIKTPVSVGQYQHGSARWLTEAEKDKEFDSYLLDPDDPVIRKLIITGYEGLSFMADGIKSGKQNGKPEEIYEKAEWQEGFGRKEASRKREEQEKIWQEDSGKCDGKETHIPIEIRRKSIKKLLESGKYRQDPHKILEYGGIVVGMSVTAAGKEKIHFISDDTHTLIIGATRSGKTRTLVVQSICLMTLAGESMVISDPKAGARRSRLKRVSTTQLNYYCFI